MKNSIFCECISEFIGTFILLFAGIGSVAALVVGGASIGAWELAICWGLAVTMAIYVSGLVSGAHLNPAVTISLAVWGGFEKKKIIPYITAQVIGGFAGAAVVYGLYSKLITVFEKSQGIVRASEAGWASLGIFSTAPHVEISMLNAFMVEVAITTLLVLVIYAVTDGKNAISGGVPALAIGLTIAMIGAAFGGLTGFAMNPARDFGPRLFAMVAGWGKYALGPNNYGLIVPIFAPIVGGLLAGAIFQKLIIPFCPICPTSEKAEKELS